MGGEGGRERANNALTVVKLHYNARQRGCGVYHIVCPLLAY